MKKILVLHGWEGTSGSHWFPWLKKAGEAKDMEVIIPDLPESCTPVLEDWLITTKEAAGNLEEGDIIIGHSMGGKAAMHFLEKYDISGVTCVLVAPTYDTIEDELDLNETLELKKKLRDFHETALDFEKLNTLKNTYTVLLSDNDHFITQTSARRYYGVLQNTHFIDFHNAGHFCKRDGFEEFPEILDYI